MNIGKSLDKLRLVANRNAAAKEYWHETITGEEEKKYFPYDNKKTAASRVTEVLKFRFPTELSNRLIGLSNNYDYTLHMILAAGVVLLLDRYTNTDTDGKDYIVGTTIYKQETEGEYINTILPVKYTLTEGNGELTFKGLLIRVKETLEKANRNQNYPIELLVHDLNVLKKQDESVCETENPLFDIAVLLENIHERRYLEGVPLNMIVVFERTGTAIRGSVEYNAALYRETTIQGITSRLIYLFEQVMADINRAIAGVELISEREKERLLRDFNNTAGTTPMEGEKNILDEYRCQAAKKPDAAAVVYGGERQLTYNGLSEKAGVLARALRERGVEPGEIVAVSAEYSLEMIIAVLAVLEAGAAYMPMAPDYPAERKRYMLTDGNIKIVLTNVTGGEITGESNVQVLDIASVTAEGETAEGETAGRGSGTGTGSRAGDLAYVMYTSGSTGTPKGVQVEHRAVVRLVDEPDYIEFREDDRILQTGALEFDASTFEIWGALLNGLTLHQEEKETIITPHKLESAIKSGGITIMWMTAPLFNQSVETGIDLFSGLRTMLVGGDTLSPHHVGILRRRYPGLTVINGYGPTENTTFSTAGPVEREYDGQKETIPIGRPIKGTTAYILDESNRPRPVGIVGELVVGGYGVARGYLNKPELTAEKFGGNYPEMLQKANPSGRFYRTGDRARWQEDGNIEFIGRIDRQVKIRGFRIEQGEIERQLQEHEDIKEALVTVKTGENNGKDLCAYVVPASERAPGSANPLAGAEVREYLTGKLPAYMIPAHIVQLERFPLNRSGKIDRNALPQPGTTETVPKIAPRNEVEERLVEQWAGILRLDRDTIGIDSNFWELGGDSLKAVQQITEIHKAFGVRLDISGVFATPTIRGIAAYIARKQGEEREDYEAIPPVEKKEYYPLSSAQKRQYVLNKMEKKWAGTGYNVSWAARLQGALDKEKFEETFRRLIKRHESLRTAFKMVNDEPVQQVADEVRFEIEYGDNRPGAVNGFIRPFDLSAAPLLRVGLFKDAPQEHILVVDMHHIITDGTSMEQVIREFAVIYGGNGEEIRSRLTPHPVQYKDYTEWRNSDKQREKLKKQEEYWLKRFEGEIPVLHLPADNPRPAVQQFDGRTLDMRLSVEETAAIKEKMLRRGVTQYMGLLALYTIYLSKLTGQEDIVVGTPVAGRSHAGQQEIVGMQVNTLPIRMFPKSEKKVDAYLQEVKETTLEAFENQDYPFDDLVEKIEVNRDTGRSPLFDVMFAQQNIEGNDVEIPGLKLKPYESERNTSKFDLSVFAVEAGNQLKLTFEYSTKLFKDETMQRYAEYFKQAVTAILRNPGRTIGEIEILPEQEKRRILEEFSGTSADIPVGKTLHGMFEEQAAATPDRIALAAGTGERGRGKTEPVLTYRQLDRKAEKLAEELRQRGIGPGAVVALKIERSVEMVTAIYGILKAGAAYLPIDPDNPGERIEYILKDSNAAQVLTGDTVDAERERAYTPGSSEAPRAAYVIYTSGSTGKPKGVVVEHSSVVNLQHELQREYPFGENDVYLLKTSFVFDVSVAELFGWYIGGGRLAILRAGGEKEPAAIIEAVEEARVTHINFVPSMFQALQEQLDDDNIKKLSTLKYIFLAGEALKPQLVERFNRHKTGIRLENIYGPTEGTVYASKYALAGWDGRGEIPIGKPLTNVKLKILDKAGNIQPIGIPGELCIAGAGVAAGYLNNPELTAARFERGLTENSDTAEENGKSERYYKTGDRARWRTDGNIEYQGRQDHQVKIRGYRVELGEIESRLAQHPEIREAAVICREDERGDKNICAYIVPVKMERYREEAQRDYLAEGLPGYMVPTYFVPLEEMPRNAAGKLDRRALPEPGASAGSRYEAPESHVESELQAIWADVLHRDKETIGRNDNFFRRGGHSLKAVGLASRMHRVFAVEIPITEIFKNPTIRGIAAYIGRSRRGVYRAVQPAEKREYYELSSAQKRLYLLQQMVKDGIGYNLPGIYRVEGEIDREKLEETFRELIRRHESLRTTFHMVGDEPVQRVREAGEIHFRVTRETAPAEDEERQKRIIRNFIRPFDLAEAPLIRVGHVEIEKKKHILMLDMHHIISDGTAMAVLVNEFADRYNAGNGAIERDGKQPPEQRIQYKDYAVHMSSEAEKADLKDREQYWREEFDGEIPVLTLPVDNPRPTVQSFRGAALEFEIETQMRDALNAVARKEGVTLYMLQLAIYKILLSRLSGAEDIVVGTPVAGRNHQELEQIIGVFINILPMRTEPEPGKTFKRYLEEVREKTVRAYSNQEYQYEELVERLAVERDAGRNPLFDVMFAFQNMETADREIAGMKLTPYPNETGTSKFDLVLAAQERKTDRGWKIVCSMEYAADLFKEESVRRFIGYYKRIAAAVAENGSIRLGEIQLVSGEEKKEILYDFNNPEFKYPRECLIHELFEAQAERTPGIEAVVDHASEPAGKSRTYRQLNESAARQARRLAEKGIETGAAVGIMLKHSAPLITGILAILKAGAAYLPINRRNPAERIKYMLADSNARVLLTDAGGREKVEGELAGTAVEIIDINEIAVETTTDPLPPAAAARRVTPADRAYIIYTSGSTGNPKGVAVAHNNLSPLLHYGNEELGIGPGDRTIQNLSYFFDWSVWEIFITITGGAALYIAGEDEMLDPGAVIDYIRRNGITVLHITPTQFQYILNHGGTLETLKYLLIGAEKLTYDMVRRTYERVGPGTRLFNQYGPTEATIITAVHEIRRGDELPETYRTLTSVPIGKPAGNAELYILDKYRNHSPVNVPGELYIGGDCVTNGYLNNPGMTAEKFIDSAALPTPDAGVMRLYRTGDQARWLDNGIIEFLGRADHQLKIRGYRIEAGEIEDRILKHENIVDAVVMCRENRAGEKYLCAYIVPHRVEEYIEAELRDSLSKELPEYMVPAYFVTLEAMPQAPNGKVDRKALPEPALTGKKDIAAPRNEIETALVRIWAGILEEEPENIRIDESFFHQGGHSLKVVGLINRVRREYSVEIPIAEVFVRPTIRAQAEYIRESAKTRYTPIEPQEEKEYYELSSAQHRLYVLKQIDPESTVYNIPVIFEAEGRLDKEMLERAFRYLIKRHESLRTSFHMREGRPVQRVHPPEVDRFRVTDYGRMTVEQYRAKEIVRDFVKPFELSEAPLLRVGRVRLEDEKYILMIDMHHIISDGVSAAVLVKEFIAYHSGEAQPEPRIRYTDYAAWQRAQKETLKEQEAYWIREFEDGAPVLALPVDTNRPAVQGFRGAAKEFEITQRDADALKAMAREKGATLFMMLQAVYGIYHSKLSGQEEIVVGTPTAGRKYPDLEQIIGVFVNTLAIKTEPAAGKTLDRYVEEVKEKTLNAFANQDYQYEDLVERLGEERDAGRNPLFDVMMVLQNIDFEEFKIPSVTLSPYRHPTETAKFDQVLTAAETKSGIAFKMEYSTDLFREETIDRYIAYYKRLVASVTEPGGIGREIREFDILPAEEKRKILYEFSGTDAEYPRDKTVHQLFERQASRRPDAVAVIGAQQGAAGETGQLTYGELNKRAGRLARRLRERNLGTGDIAAIRMERSVEMIIGILGILKAGGAYLPVDPAYPDERIDYMLTDSGVKYCVVAGNPEPRGTIHDSPMILLDALEDSGDPATYAPVEPAVRPADPAYVIYTSGTTGKPKGVLIEHRNVVRLMVNREFQFDFSEKDIWTVFHSFCFDFSVWEMYGALHYGGKQVIVPVMESRDTVSFLKRLKKESVTVLNQTPSAFYNLIGQERQQARDREELALRYVIFGGEALRPAKMKEWMERYPGIRHINMYGITETTVHVTYREIAREDVKGDISNIGAAIPTLSCYILDRNHGLSPIGVPGELCVGGAGVGRGYLNRPELTQEKFIGGLPGEPAVSTGSDGRIYRSGDLAKWRPDGSIEYLGRIDRQVKIRGFRIELGEIENRLLSHEKINEAVVQAKETGPGGKSLCAYIVPAPGDEQNRVEAVQLKEYLARFLPEYMIPAFFIRLEKMPLTSNGKINRKKLPEPTIESGGEGGAPESPAEKALAGAWEEVLGVQRAGNEDNFFEIGGDSIKAIQVAARLKDAGYELEIKDIFTNPQLAEQALTLKEIEKAEDRQNGGDGGDGEALQPHQRFTYKELPKELYDRLKGRYDIEDIYRLTPMQEGMLFHALYDNTSTLFINQMAYRHYGDLDTGVIVKTVNRLIERYDILRTVFIFESIDGDERPLQLVRKRQEANIDIRDIEGMGTDEQKEEYLERLVEEDRRNAFDLGSDLLLRLTIVKAGPEEYQFIWTYHCMLMDGWSRNAVILNFAAIYAAYSEGGEPRLKPVTPFNRYVEWLERRDKKESADYWRKYLEGFEEIAEVPKKAALKKDAPFEPGTATLHIDGEKTGKLKEQASRNRVTVNIVFQSLWAIQLAKYSGKDDVAFGNTVSGRPPEIEGIETMVGLFTNMIPARIRLRPEETFGQMQRRVHEDAGNSEPHHSHPLVEIQAESPRKQDIFDNIYTFGNFPGVDKLSESAGSSRETMERLTANLGNFSEFEQTSYDLTVYVNVGERSAVHFVYNANVYNRDFMEKIPGHLEEILDKIIENPDITVKELIELESLDLAAGVAVIETTVFGDQQPDFDF